MSTDYTVSGAVQREIKNTKEKYHGSKFAKFHPHGTYIEGYKYDTNGSIRSPKKEGTTKRDRKYKQKLRRKK